MSLKETLKTHISRKNGKVLSFEEAEVICKREGRRVSNMERRMRELMNECEFIQTIRSKKNAIVGWAWNVPRYPSQEKLGFMRGVL